jgi:uncharacterized protein (TIGR02599 family)
MKTPARSVAAFTLVEVLVASGIVVIIMGVLLGMTDQTQRLVKSTSSKVEQFQDARIAFESMTRHLAQATLNTYWDYEYNANHEPTRYLRSSELRFISGISASLLKNGAAGTTRPGHCVFFHAPLGIVDDKTALGSLDHLINVLGYYVELGNDETGLPTFLANKGYGRKRFRLMELRQPSEQLVTYKYQDVAKYPTDWFAPLLTSANPPVRVLAENIVALVILPRLSRADELLWMKNKGTKTAPVLAPSYSFDSTNKRVADPILNPRNQLPPVVQVAMVAIDEPSARLLEDKYSSDPNLGLDYSRNFRNPALLEDDPGTSQPNDGDLSVLEALLVKQRVSYRIFSTNVSIRGAKWSRNQKN